MQSTMKNLISYTLLFTSIFYSGLILAQGQSPSASASTSQSADSLPAEIVVTPLMNRRYLRSLISQVEEDFVERFNELNLDEKYDIDCYQYSATSTHIRKEICEPIFFRRARSNDASLAAFNMTQVTTVFHLESIQIQTDRGLRQRLGQEYVVLQEKIAGLTNSDEALKTLVKNLNELNYSLENYGKND